LINESDPTETKTRIDLGEDLLEETRLNVLPEAQKTPELLENARILLNEGFLEEAKKVLRKILLREPSNISAQKKLSDIHDTELRQIFGSDQTQVRYAPGKTAPAPTVSSDEVMKKLDRDFSLGIFDLNGEELSPAEAIFDSERDMIKFADRLDRNHAGSSARDRLDLGVGFLEMGFYTLAQRQFQAASQAEELRVPALILEAYCEIASSQAFAASLKLEALARESELILDEKLEIFYLLGRAYEKLEKKHEALAWFQQTSALNPKYRDVHERLLGAE